MGLLKISKVYKIEEKRELPNLPEKTGAKDKFETVTACSIIPPEKVYGKTEGNKLPDDYYDAYTYGEEIEFNFGMPDRTFTCREGRITRPRVELQTTKDIYQDDKENKKAHRKYIVIRSDPTSDNFCEFLPLKFPLKEKKRRPNIVNLSIEDALDEITNSNEDYWESGKFVTASFIKFGNYFIFEKRKKLNRSARFVFGLCDFDEPQNVVDNLNKSKKINDIYHKIHKGTFKFHCTKGIDYPKEYKEVYKEALSKVNDVMKLALKMALAGPVDEEEKKQFPRVVDLAEILFKNMLYLVCQNLAANKDTTKSMDASLKDGETTTTLHDIIMQKDYMVKDLRYAPIDELEFRTFRHFGCINPSLLKMLPGNNKFLGVYDKKRIGLFNIENKNILHEYTGHTKEITALTLHLPQNWLIAGAKDNTIRIWELDKKKSIKIIPHGHSDSITAIVIRPDGKYLFTSSVDKTIKIINVKRCLIIKEFRFEVAINNLVLKQNSIDVIAESEVIASIALHPNEKNIFFTSFDSVVTVFDISVENCPEVKKYKFNMPVKNVVISEDNLLIIQENGTLYSALLTQEHEDWEQFDEEYK